MGIRTSKIKAIAKKKNLNLNILSHFIRAYKYYVGKPK